MKPGRRNGLKYQPRGCSQRKLSHATLLRELEMFQIILYRLTGTDSSVTSSVQRGVVDKMDKLTGMLTLRWLTPDDRSFRGLICNPVCSVHQLHSGFDSYCNVSIQSQELQLQRGQTVWVWTSGMFHVADGTMVENVGNMCQTADKQQDSSGQWTLIDRDRQTDTQQGCP